MTPAAVGIDGCSGGWVVAAWAPGGVPRLFTLERLGYDDWIAFDIVCKEHDSPQVFTDAAAIAKEREIYEAQAAESGKPAEIVAKMVEGRVNKYKAEVSMTEQPFVKDGNVKVKDLLKDAGATLETMIRFEVGEGIEKEETDFAAEVAAQVRGEA